MMWIEYHHGPYDKDVCGIFRGTKEQIVKHYVEEWGEEDLDYDTLMSHSYQSDMDFTLEEIDEDIIVDL
jgi:hypothetical protein